MPKLIKDGAVADNLWQTLPLDDAPESAQVPQGKVIVPLAVWEAQKASLAARDDVGVWLQNDQAAEALADDAANLPLIAVDFPLFMDGRGFSIARLLRERHNFTGELRAQGHFIRDQLSYLSRCGFNAFDCNETFDLESALSSMADLTEFYQTAVDQNQPLFRRRA
jgi:uncharacterized protein (DUF934 family)